MLSNASLPLVCLFLTAACIGAGEGPADADTDTSSDTELSVDEWIELCESKSGIADCEAVAPGMRGGETWWCEHATIVQADPATCQFQQNDSRCFAASSPGSGLDYVYLDPDSGAWLIEPTSPDDMNLHGSGVQACGMDPLCACADMVVDEAGG